MPIAQSLADFQASISQCDNLISAAHRTDQNAAYLFSNRDREQITFAAFLNMFIAWEEFLEAALSDFMMGDSTVSGRLPIKYVAPLTREHSSKILVHVNKYFDFAKHENVKKISKLYFQGGYPFETPLNSIISDLADLKTMRNACAHLSSTTRTSLESLANRIFGQPQPGINVYQLLTSIDPRFNSNITVYEGYKDKLGAAAILIAQG